VVNKRERKVTARRASKGQVRGPHGYHPAHSATSQRPKRSIMARARSAGILARAEEEEKVKGGAVEGGPEMDCVRVSTGDLRGLA
jgi:hypothetical protein